MNAAHLSACFERTATTGAQGVRPLQKVSGAGGRRINRALSAMCPPSGNMVTCSHKELHEKYLFITFTHNIDVANCSSGNRYIKFAGALVGAMYV